jgi:hypothetical protein
MASKMSHGERVLLGRIGAYTALSRHSAYEMTEPARRGFASKFEREVDPEGLLEPEERARRAEMARKAYFARLALLSAQARRKKAASNRP